MFVKCFQIFIVLLFIKSPESLSQDTLRYGLLNQNKISPFDKLQNETGFKWIADKGVIEENKERKLFLVKLQKLYSPGEITIEKTRQYADTTFQEKRWKEFTRWMFNTSREFVVLEKLEHFWGGIFYMKNGIMITEQGMVIELKNYNLTLKNK